MKDSTKSGMLQNLIQHLSGDAAFIAGWLPSAAHATGEFKRRLQLDTAAEHRFLLCRPPRRDHFAADIRSIASFVNIDPSSLVMALREIVAIGSLSQADFSLLNAPVSPSMVLAAARDFGEEPFKISGHRPRRRAELILEKIAKAGVQSEDLEAAIAWCSPIAVIVLPHLALSSVTEWLSANGVMARSVLGDRQLRGLLIASRGSGLIFVDGALPAEERRLTVAHEWGHFLIDYEEPRNKVLTRVPDLLDVVDGHRAATADDRVRAIIDQVPLGLHAHLLERDDAGNMTWEVSQAEDSATDFAIEVLAPWNVLLRLLQSTVRPNNVYDMELDRASERVAKEFCIPKTAARSRARAGLAAIGVHRSFFDR